MGNGGQGKRVIGFEPTTFTLATCGRRVLRHDAPKTYGASQITLHFSLPKGDEVVQRMQHGVARGNLRTHVTTSLMGPKLKLGGLIHLEAVFLPQQESVAVPA